MTPTFSKLSVWGEVVNRERDPKCKQTKSPRLRSGPPPIWARPWVLPPDTSTYTHSPPRSCQNPDILINPRSTTLTDAAERWMQKWLTLDPCRGGREYNSYMPRQPPPLSKMFPLRHRRALPAPLLPQTMMEESPFILELGTGGQGAPVTPQEHQISMQTLSHTIGPEPNTKTRLQSKCRVLNPSH